MNEGANTVVSFFQGATDAKIKDISASRFFDIIGESSQISELSVEESENNWIYEYWPTQYDFQHQQTTSKQHQHSNTSVFTHPKFSITEPMEDPIKQLVIKYYGAQEASKRLLPTCESVTPDVNGLEKLIKCGSFRSVVDLTHKILKQITTTNDRTQYAFALQVWLLRISMLYKLKLFKEAELEVHQFENLDKPEYFYQFYCDLYPNRKGSMVPFSFRILKAELGVYIKKSDDSLTQLSNLLVITNKVLKELKETPKAVEVWTMRRINIQMAIINILINNQNYDKVLSLLEVIAESEYTDKGAIWSYIGKVLIQIGDVNGAKQAFLKAKAYFKEDDNADKCRDLINISLLEIANSAYEDAHTKLSEANQLISDNSLVINNTALCLFYTGKLREAIKILESHIFKNPTKQLNEGLLFNLCTLYELESAKAQQKKFNILLWLNMYVGDGFYEASLKLN